MSASYTNHATGLGSPIAKRRIEKCRKFRTGSTLFFAICGVVLLGMVGLATDVGHVYYVSHQLQNAADAAALAAAYELAESTDGARSAAVYIGSQNEAAGISVTIDPNHGNSPDGDVVIGFYNSADGTFTPTEVNPNAVKVVARRVQGSADGGVELYFGPLFSVDSANIEREAIAVLDTIGEPGIIALNLSVERSFRIQGNGRIEVSGGNVYVNSNDPSAYYMQGNAFNSFQTTYVTGDTQIVGNPDIDGNVMTGTDPVPDPLEHIPAPDPADYGTDYGTISVQNGVHNLQPGYYPGGIATTGGELNLAPGIYVLDGAGFQIGANTVVRGDGVMLYVMGTGVVDIQAGADINLSPSKDPDNIYYNITVFQARDNTNQAEFHGTPGMNLTGTYYFKNAKLYMAGTGGIYGNQLIADQVEIRGDGNITIDFNSPYTLPARDVYLAK